MGELGWSLQRWEGATITEFNYAAGGYWRNWERFAGVPMREICYVQIAGNPNIKQSAKPASVKEFMRLSIDKDEPVVTQKPTAEDIEKARKAVFDGK